MYICSFVKYLCSFVKYLCRQLKKMPILITTVLCNAFAAQNYKGNENFSLQITNFCSRPKLISYHIFFYQFHPPYSQHTYVIFKEFSCDFQQFIFLRHLRFGLKHLHVSTQFTYLDSHSHCTMHRLHRFPLYQHVASTTLAIFLSS